MLDDVEGGGRVRVDEKAGELWEGMEAKYLMEWREMGRNCRGNCIICKFCKSFNGNTQYQELENILAAKGIKYMKYIITA